eukprot:scaffold25948_cov117-Cylindrotheca_fusiformis.AAC.2
MWTTPQFRDKKTLLPADFVLQPYSVRIGRGKACSEATGNQRLQVLASSFLDDYKKASTKIEKSVIVTKIVDTIQEACPVGAFVRYQDGRWWEVDDFTARGKVGSTIRDLLSDEYRSSSKAKFARRKRQKQDSLTTVTASGVGTNLDALSSDLPPGPRDHQEKIAATKKPPPQHQEVTKQGDNVACSSQGLNDEGLLSDTYSSSAKAQAAQGKKQREVSLTNGTMSVIDSILDLRSSDLAFRPQARQEKMAGTKKPPPQHHTLSEQGDAIVRPNEWQRLNEGNRATPPALNASSNIASYQDSMSAKAKRTKSQQPSSSSMDMGDFPDIDIDGDFRNFPW